MRCCALHFLEMALTMQLGAWKATGAVQRQGARTTTVVLCVHVRAAPHAALLIPPPLDCQQHPIVRHDTRHATSPAVYWTLTGG